MNRVSALAHGSSFLRQNLNIHEPAFDNVEEGGVTIAGTIWSYDLRPLDRLWIPLLVLSAFSKRTPKTPMFLVTMLIYLLENLHCVEFSGFPSSLTGYCRPLTRGVRDWLKGKVLSHTVWFCEIKYVLWISRPRELKSGLLTHTQTLCFVPVLHTAWPSPEKSYMCGKVRVSP